MRQQPCSIAHHSMTSPGASAPATFRLIASSTSAPHTLSSCCASSSCPISFFRALSLARSRSCGVLGEEAARGERLGSGCWSGSAPADGRWAWGTSRMGGEARLPRAGDSLARPPCPPPTLSFWDWAIVVDAAGRCASAPPPPRRAWARLRADAPSSSASGSGSGARGWACFAAPTSLVADPASPPPADSAQSSG